MSRSTPPFAGTKRQATFSARQRAQK